MTGVNNMSFKFNGKIQIFSLVAFSPLFFSHIFVSLWPEIGLQTKIS